VQDTAIAAASMSAEKLFLLQHHNACFLETRPDLPRDAHTDDSPTDNEKVRMFHRRVFMWWIASASF
jgi:hypothetical protein